MVTMIHDDNDGDDDGGDDDDGDDDDDDDDDDGDDDDELGTKIRSSIGFFSDLIHEVVLSKVMFWGPKHRPTHVCMPPSMLINDLQVRPLQGS